MAEVCTVATRKNRINSFKIGEHIRNPILQSPSTRIAYSLLTLTVRLDADAVAEAADAEAALREERKEAEAVGLTSAVAGIEA